MKNITFRSRRAPITKGLNTDTKHNTEAGLKLKRKNTQYGPVYEILVLIESVSSEGFGKSAHMCRLARAFAAYIHEI